MPYSAVLFDLDGTLLDTLADIAAAANRVLAHSGFPQHAAGDYRDYIGEGMAIIDHPRHLIELLDGHTEVDEAVLLPNIPERFHPCP